MNRKQIRILLILLIVFSGAGIVFRSRTHKSWTGGGQAVGQKLLGAFQVNDVAQIVIQQGTNEVNVARRDDVWRVHERGDYPANFGSISSLLLKLRDLKVVQTEQVGASQLGRLDLLPPGPGSNTATKVELRDTSGKAIKTLLLGKKHMAKSTRPSQFGEMEGGWPDGRYVVVDAASGHVDVISDALNDIEPQPQSWLSKDFVKIEKVKSVAAAFAEATNSWKLARETESGEWKLADAAATEKLDTSKLYSFNTPLSSVSISDVSIGLSPDQTGLAHPATLTVETFDGLSYVLNSGAQTNSDVFASISLKANLTKERTPGKDEKPEDKLKLDKEFSDNLKQLESKVAEESALAKWTYLLPNWSLESLMKKRGELLEVKKEESPAKPEDSPIHAEAPAVPSSPDQ